MCRRDSIHNQDLALYTMLHAAAYHYFLAAAATVALCYDGTSMSAITAHGRSMSCLGKR